MEVNHWILHPIVMFCLGLIAGSTVGINGLVLLAMGGIGYYYRVPIFGVVPPEEPTMWDQIRTHVETLMSLSK